MRTTEIRLKIELDDHNVPEKLFWLAEDGASHGLEETKAFALSIWDHSRKETLKIDLWAKDMPVHEMKRFFVDSIASMARTLESATNDKVMSQAMDELCERMAIHLQQEAR